MTLIITKSINPDDQQELFAGLRQYNQQYLDAAQFGDLGIYSRDAQGVMQGGLIAKRKGNWLCIEIYTPFFSFDVSPLLAAICPPTV